jgi:acylphosphatase
MKARRFFFSGHVQGVGFRYSVKQLAAGFDVCGWVRNLNDGRVELFMQGESAEIEAMDRDIRLSHLGGFIRGIESYDVELDENLKGFSIRA